MEPIIKDILDLIILHKEEELYHDWRDGKMDYIIDEKLETFNCRGILDGHYIPGEKKVLKKAIINHYKDIYNANFEKWKKENF